MVDKSVRVEMGPERAIESQAVACLKLPTPKVGKIGGLVYGPVGLSFADAVRLLPTVRQASACFAWRNAVVSNFSFPARLFGTLTVGLNAASNALANVPCRPHKTRP